MAKITSVEPQKSSKGRSAYGRKNNRRYNIYLDGEFAFGADEDLVVEHRLVPGKVLDTSDAERLLFEVEVGKLIERMYRLSNIRQRSEKEIRDYLKNLSFKRKIKGIDEISTIVIDSTVDKLKRKGLINDLEFSKAWVDARSKKYGPQRIKQELFKKGIDKEIIEEVIGSWFLVHGGTEVAALALEKKIRLWRDLPELEFKKKAYDFLLRRGFEYSVVKDVVRRIDTGLKNF